MMVTQPLRRPLIPAELYKPSLLGTVAFITYAIALCVVPAALSRMILASFDSVLLRVVLMTPLTIIAGYGFQLIGFVGHEGLHLSLHRNKIISILLGLFFASSIVTYFEMGFALQHWNHHRFTNQASDADIQAVSHLKTWWQRLLFARATYNFLYIRRVIRIALGHACSFRYQMPLKAPTVRTLCWINLVLGLFWIGIYAVITIYDPLTGLFSIALPMVVTMLISSCQTFIDHAGTSDQLFCNAWSRTSPLMTAVYFGANYHLEHHLYPGVPCYRLPKVHRLLKDSGIYEKVDAPIESSFFGSYRRIFSEYKAGTDSSFDPFKLAVE